MFVERGGAGANYFPSFLGEEEIGREFWGKGAEIDRDATELADHGKSGIAKATGFN
jgi:hypothetical protein